MPTPIDPVKLHRVMQVLGIMPNELQGLQRLPIQEGQRRFAEIKERVHKNYKKAAFELHPDRTGNDPEKTELFKLIGTVKDDFDKLQLERRPVLRPPPPPMPMQVQVVRVVSWASVGSTYNRTTATNTVAVGVPLRVATLRPT